MAMPMGESCPVAIGIGVRLMPGPPSGSQGGKPVSGVPLSGWPL